MSNPFPDGKFEIIYADPPWAYRGKMMKPGKRGKQVYAGDVTQHYPTMTERELLALDVKKLAAKNCLLFMWAVSPNLDQAIRLGEAWGFKFKTVAFVWDKQGECHGYYTRGRCEFCLVFKRGNIPKGKSKRGIGQLISVARTKHSAKPNEVRNRIGKMFYQHSKIELFARERVDGWQSWGNEV